jgi:hypothetical protein
MNADGRLPRHPIRMPVQSRSVQAYLPIANPSAYLNREQAGTVRTHTRHVDIALARY